MMDEDTIFAPMTAAGRSAITALRISGPGAAAALLALAGRLPEPRRASLCRLHDHAGEVLDEAVVLWFPAPRSYTGEDVAELHLHGGRAVLEGVAEALTALGLRMAAAGEFSRRAFLSGRLDLLQAEAIGDLVAAETAAQRRQALRQMDGALGALYERWSDELTTLLAHQEALIDFPDEALPPEIEAATVAGIAGLARAIQEHLADGRRGERVREGLVFVVQGAPNAGKSTLVNALAGRDVAIVSPRAGTTRDTLEVTVTFADVPVTLVDTAGLRDTADPIEAEGVRRARAKAARADLILDLQAADGPAAPDAALDGRVPALGGEADERPTPERLRLRTKADLCPPDATAAPDGVALAVSAQTGFGMAELHATLSAIARQMTEASGPPPLTRQRHRAQLQEAAGHLQAALEDCEIELRAEALRLARRAIGGITGTAGVEALLDRIFADFCIGK